MLVASSNTATTPDVTGKIPPQSKRQTYPWRRTLWLVLGLLVLLLGYKAVRIGQQAWAAYRAGQELQTLAHGGLQLDKLPQAQASTQKLANALTGMTSELQPLQPLLHHLGWTPRYGPMLAATPELLTASRELTALASEGLTLLNATPRGPKPTDPQILFTAFFSTTLATAQPQLSTMAGHATRAEQALQKVPINQLPPALAERLRVVQPLLPLLSSGLTVGTALPNLLGFKDAKTYLILVQNNHELRATGGFISALGKLTVDKGRIAGMEFVDSYKLFREDVNYPAAPEPMQRYMDVPLMLVRDANWSPDLPTTAKLVKALYAQETGTSVDGIVTIDLRAVQLIVGALGPLSLPGAPAPITGDNIIEQIKQFWAKPPETGDTIQTKGLGQWWGQRKDFMPTLAKAALQRVQSGQFAYKTLLENTQAALNERAVQIWLAEPTAETQLTSLGWDGGLHPQPDQDFLALVDTNMGYNKVNAVLKRSLSYTVTWSTDATQPAQATVAIRYTNPVTQTDPVCAPKAYYGNDYDDMIKRCYFNYVRLYIPAEHQFVGVAGVQPDSVTKQRGEQNLRVYAGYFMLKPGETKTITFRYQLPARLQPNHYALLIQRQAGSGPLPLTVQIGQQTTTTLLKDGRFIWPP
ncbi:MAG: DUF4012 domain-containing protein [Caldilineaceae bacterium]